MATSNTKKDLVTPPEAPSDEIVSNTTTEVAGLSLDNTFTSGSPHDTTSHPTSQVEEETTSLGLPTAASDAPVITTPLGRPLETSKPKPRSPPSADQLKKYDALLDRVSRWTEVPTRTTAGAQSAPLEPHERMFLTRDCLFRYLRATSWKVDQAETRLKATLAWRREYGTDKKLTADYISVENETGKQVILGWDNEGRPCQYLRPSKQNTDRSDRQIEHLVYMLERTIDIMPPGQETLALLINFAETKSGQGATLAQGKQTLYILQNHYPERLGRALVTNVPFMIWGFFKLITPFIDPLTREKIKFNEDMGHYIPREQLMRESQGSVNFEYNHQTYWPALTKLAEIKRAAYRERWERAGSRIGEDEAYLRGGDRKPLIEIERQSTTT